MPEESQPDIENSELPRSVLQQVAGPMIPNMSEINDVVAEQGSNFSPIMRPRHFPSAQINILNQSQDYPVSDGLNSNRMLGRNLRI